MPITAQSSDGVSHEFPDGTDQAVIDKAMKGYAAQATPPAAAEGTVTSLPESWKKVGPNGEVTYEEPQEKSSADMIREFADKYLTPNYDGPSLIGAIGQAVKGFADEADRMSGKVPPMTPNTPQEMALLTAIAGVRSPGAGTGKAISAISQKMAAEQYENVSAQMAKEAGYVLPPNMAGENVGRIGKLMQGWAGKSKTAQLASSKNQEVTNKLAAQALGLPEDATLNEAEFSKVRAEAGKAYAAVANSIPVVVADKQFKDEIAALGGASSQAAKYFPGIMKNSGVDALIKELSTRDSAPPQAAIEVVKKLRFDANANLKAPGDPAKHALGLSQRQAADAIDDLVERNLESAAAQGGGVQASIPYGLVDHYRSARQLIAKSYDVQGATNPATGDVNAAGLAKLANKGRPLTGELETIAHTANAFPKAVQNPATFGGVEDHSSMDFFGSALTFAHGDPGVAATILGRPLARGAILSKPYQDAIIPTAPKAPPAPTPSGGLMGAISPEAKGIAGAISGQSSKLAPAVTGTISDDQNE